MVWHGVDNATLKNCTVTKIQKERAGLRNWELTVNWKREV
jgi:hypothetical protein